MVRYLSNGMEENMRRTMFVERYTCPVINNYKISILKTQKRLNLSPSEYLQWKLNRMSASAKNYASMTYYLIYRSRTIWRIHPSSSKVGDVHNKPSALRSEDILARVSTLGLVTLGAEAVRLVGMQMRRRLVPVCRKWGPGITGGMVGRKVPRSRCTIPTPGVFFFFLESIFIYRMCTWDTEAVTRR
jgi:hypothetical protein